MNRNYFHSYSPFHYDLFKHKRSIDYKCSILPSFHTFNSIKPCRTQTIQNVSCEFCLQSHSPASPLHSHFYVYRSLAWRQLTSFRLVDCPFTIHSRNLSRPLVNVAFPRYQRVHKQSMQERSYLCQS